MEFPTFCLNTLILDEFKFIIDISEIERYYRCSYFCELKTRYFGHYTVLPLSITWIPVEVTWINRKVNVGMRNFR